MSSLFDFVETKLSTKNIFSYVLQSKLYSSVVLLSIVIHIINKHFSTILIATYQLTSKALSKSQKQYRSHSYQPSWKCQFCVDMLLDIRE